VLACAVRLLDLGFFRIGGEQYASENQSYGLATLRKEHVVVGRDGTLSFEFVGKSGKLWERSLAEPEVLSVVSALKRDGRRAGAAGLPSGPAGRRSGSTSRAPTSTATSARSPAATAPPRTSGPGRPP
jgi:hypothetical protein